jgi:hypothetical protein
MDKILKNNAKKQVKWAFTRQYFIGIKIKVQVAWKQKYESKEKIGET